MSDESQLDRPITKRSEPVCYGRQKRWDPPCCCEFQRIRRKVRSVNAIVEKARRSAKFRSEEA